MKSKSSVCCSKTEAFQPGKEPEEIEGSDDEYANVEGFLGSEGSGSEAAHGSSASSDDDAPRSPGGGAVASSKKSGKLSVSDSSSIAEILVATSSVKKKVYRPGMPNYLASWAYSWCGQHCRYFINFVKK